MARSFRHEMIDDETDMTHSRNRKVYKTALERNRRNMQRYVNNQKRSFVNSYIDNDSEYD